MTTTEFHAKIREWRGNKPRWCIGQTMFNFVWETDGMLADAARATDVDPFYQDKRCEKFIEYLVERGFINDNIKE